MKNIKYILFTILFLFLNIFHVQATCTNEEISLLRKESDKIKITYKHLGKIETDEGVYYNSFDVTIKNIPTDFYVVLEGLGTKYTPADNTVKETFDSGTWIFEFYSNKCEKKISTVKVKLPIFNVYSLDPLCEGIDGDDFSLCGKYYEYNVSYENFKERVTHYRLTHKIDDKKNEPIEEKNSTEKIFAEIVSFLNNNLLYIAVSLVIFIVILITIIIMKNRKKRGVLK